LLATKTKHRITGVLRQPLRTISLAVGGCVLVAMATLTVLVGGSERDTRSSVTVIADNTPSAPTTRASASAAPGMKAPPFDGAGWPGPGPFKGQGWRDHW
jgi:hypothetical protein